MNDRKREQISYILTEVYLNGASLERPGCDKSIDLALQKLNALDLEVDVCINDAKKDRPNYKYKIFNAQICIRCQCVEVSKTQTRIIGMVCNKCNKELQKLYTAWNKTGIYIGKNNDKTYSIIKGG